MQALKPQTLELSEGISAFLMRSPPSINTIQVHLVLLIVSPQSNSFYGIFKECWQIKMLLTMERRGLSAHHLAFLSNPIASVLMAWCCFCFGSAWTSHWNVLGSPERLSSSFKWGKSKITEILGECCAIECVFMGLYWKNKKASLTNVRTVKQFSVVHHRTWTTTVFSCSIPHGKLYKIKSTIH